VVEEMAEREREKMEHEELEFEKKLRAARQAEEERDREAAQRKYEADRGIFVTQRMKKQHILLITCREHIRAVLAPYTSTSEIKSIEVIVNAEQEAEDQKNFLLLEKDIICGLKDLTDIHRKFEIAINVLKEQYKKEYE